jgi:pyrroline-5-carboxylate reductase
MKTLGFIGAGNMGFAMMQGALTSFSREGIVYTDKNLERLEYIKKTTNLEYVKSNKACVLKSDIVVLGIKPQYLEEVLCDIKDDDLNYKIFITVAPGISIAYIKGHLGQNVKVVRAMPNTPALVAEGMSAICFSEDEFLQEERDIIIQFFESFGKTALLTEAQLDMVVPVSGSSPAYVYMFIEAMADAAVSYGLPRDVAYTLAAQSVYGSAKMVLETKEHPGVLKDAVCSPGGTTIAAVKVLEKAGFRSAVMEAMDACYDKTLSFKNKK